MQSAPERRLAPAGLFFVLGILALTPYAAQYHAGMNDEGVVLAAAARMLQGEVPYRDFDLLYTPGSMAVTAAWQAVFGISMGSARFLMTVCAGLLAALIFLVSDRLLSRPFAFVPPLLFLVSGYSEWPVVSYHWFSISGLMVAVIFLLDWCQSRKPWLMLACGVAVGLAALCLQSEGLAGLLTVTAVVCLTRPLSWRPLLVFVGGIALVWAPFLMLLAVLGAAPAMIDQTILRVLGGLYRHHGAPYDVARFIGGSWSQIASQWPSTWGWPQASWALESTTMASMWTLKYGLLFPVLLAAVALCWRRGGHWRAFAVLLVAWAFMRRERMEMLYTNYWMVTWYVALVMLWEAAWRWRRSVAVAVGAVVVPLFALSLFMSMRAAAHYSHPIETRAAICTRARRRRRHRSTTCTGWPEV